MMKFKGKMGSFEEIILAALGLTLQFPGMFVPFPADSGILV